MRGTEPGHAEDRGRRPEILQGAEPATQLLRCQYLYFCTSNASQLSSKMRGAEPEGPDAQVVVQPALKCQYLYFCTSKASKLSTC